MHYESKKILLGSAASKWPLVISSAIERQKYDFWTNELANRLIRTEIFPKSVMHLDNLLERSLLQLMHWRKLFAVPKLKATHVGLQGHANQILNLCCQS